MSCWQKHIRTIILLFFFILGEPKCFYVYTFGKNDCFLSKFCEIKVVCQISVLYISCTFLIAASFLVVSNGPILKMNSMPACKFLQVVYIFLSNFPSDCNVFSILHDHFIFIKRFYNHRVGLETNILRFYFTSLLIYMFLFFISFFSFNLPCSKNVLPRRILYCVIVSWATAHKHEGMNII